MIINSNFQKKRLLSEAKKVEDIANAIGKNNPNINVKELSELLLFGDPTSNDNGKHGKFVGKYWKWIAELFIKGSVNINDSERLNAAINTYNINKTVINRPIDSFNSLNELESFLETNNYDNNFKQGRQVSKADREIETVYEDNVFVIKIPHTYEASRKIGGDTHWCTASSDRHYYDYYKSKYGGEYYVIINKINGEKYQIHPESNQFKNEDDYDVCFNELSYSKKDVEGIIKFFESKGVNISKYANGIYLEDFINGLKNAEDKIEYIRNNSLMFSSGIKSNGNIFLVVNKLANLYNVNTNTFLFDNWFRIVTRFNKKNNEVCFTLKDNNGKYHIYDSNVNLINYSFNDIRTLSRGFDKTQLICIDNTGCYIFNINTYEFIKSEFDNIKVLNWFVYSVYLNGKANAIPREKAFEKNALNYVLLENWYDDIIDFKINCLVIKNNNLYNLFSLNNKKNIFDEWFDGYYGVNDDELFSFNFSLNGEKVFVNNKLQIKPYIDYTSCSCINPNEEDFDESYIYYIVSKDNKHNVVDSELNLKFTEWYDEIKPLSCYENKSSYDDEDYDECQYEYVEGFELKNGNKKTYVKYDNDSFDNKSYFWFDEIAFYARSRKTFEVFGFCGISENRYYVVDKNGLIKFGDLDKAVLSYDIGGQYPYFYIEKNDEFNYVTPSFNELFKYWIDKSYATVNENYSSFVINGNTYKLTHIMGDFCILFLSKDGSHKYYSASDFNDMMFGENVEKVSAKQIQEAIVKALITYLN